MTQKKWLGPRASRYATLLISLVALAGFGVLGVHQLSVARLQAEGLVSEGRTELHQGLPAQAVVSFERARLLAPRADFVRSALRDANVRDVEVGAAHAVNWLAPREWSFLLVAFGWMAGLSLAVGIARRQGGRIARRLAFAAGLLFALSALGVVQSTLSSRALRVVSSATGVLIAPYAGAGAIADLPPGVVVAAGPRYGQFIQVSGPNGIQGWVTESTIESVAGT